MPHICENSRVSKMKWRPARPGDKAAVMLLLQTNEAAWISLVDRFLGETVRWYRNFALLEDPSAVHQFQAVFFLNDSGLGMLAVRPDFQGDLLPDELHRLFRRRFDRLFCLMGPAERLQVIQSVLIEPPEHSTRYFILEKLADSPSAPPTHGFLDWPIPPVPEKLWRGLNLRRASTQDASRLFELQCQYELEEVLVPGHQLNPDQTRRQLESSLRQHNVWLAESGSVTVAKAGTNGLSWRYAQIGGVFTLPEWRQHGVGEQLMKTVLEDIFSAGLNACLFVKQQNKAALRLYEKLGFQPAGELIISYFK